MWDTVRCRHCRSRVPSIAIYCPHCNTRIPTPSRFSARNFIVQFWLILAVIVAGLVWYIFGQLGLGNSIQAQGSALRTTPTVVAQAPATPLPGPKKDEVVIRLVEPPAAQSGQWVRFEVAVENKSDLPAHVVSIRISKEYFDGYRVDSTEPALLADHVEADGYRHFDFPGMPSKTSGVYRFNMVRTKGSLPIEAKIEVFTHSGSVFDATFRPK